MTYGAFYEFPANRQDVERLVAFHKEQGRTWVSSAMVKGRQRMKFVSNKKVRTFEHRHYHECSFSIEAPQSKRKLISYAGKEERA